MQIIKNGEIVLDRWTLISDDPIPSAGCIIVSLSRWVAEKPELLARDGELGIFVTAENTLDIIKDDLKHFQLIALDFAVFTDGRSFSFARLLRNRYGYTGELRAIGQFIRDQLFFLQRVGVDSFSFNEPTNLKAAVLALNDFSVHYQ